MFGTRPRAHCKRLTGPVDSLVELPSPALLYSKSCNHRCTGCSVPSLRGVVTPCVLEDVEKWQPNAVSDCRPWCQEKAALSYIEASSLSAADVTRVAGTGGIGGAGGSIAGRAGTTGANGTVSVTTA